MLLESSLNFLHVIVLRSDLEQDPDLKHFVRSDPDTCRNKSFRTHTLRLRAMLFDVFWKGCFILKRWDPVLNPV